MPRYQSIGWRLELAGFKIDQSDISDSVSITFTSMMVHIMHQSAVER